MFSLGLPVVETLSKMTERDAISSSSQSYGAIAAPPTVAFADFSPTELYNLSESIADNVTAINSGLRELEKFLKQIAGPNDSVQLREKVHNTQQMVNGKVTSTTRDIQRLGVVVRRGDKPQKLQVERLTQAFKDAVAKYSVTQKQLAEKMAANMPRQSRPSRQDPMLMEQQAIADDEEATLIANQQAQARLVQFETSMLLEKEAYINQIQADVIDVNLIMKTLAESVNEQAQNVDTLASHIESAASDVEAGRDELAKAAEHQRRYRRKKLILSLIAIVIAILLIVWIVKAFR